MHKLTLLRILKSLILFFLMFFIADRCIGHYLETIYFKQKDGEFFQTIYAVKQAREDVLIFGSSRATHHYVSKIFEKELALSTYNIGRDGRNILYSNAIFSQILTYHRPKVIILDVQLNEFSWKAGKEGEDAMIAALLPYADLQSIRKNIINLRKNEIVLSEIFKTYPYNSYMVQMLAYNYGSKNKLEDNKGYMPLKGSHIKEERKVSESRIDKNAPSKDSILLQKFADFLKLAKSRGVMVYVVVSPIYQEKSSNSIPDLKGITKQYGFHFYDYSTSKQFQKKELFYDESHLNDKGAIIFSSFLAKELKKQSFEENIKFYKKISKN